MMRLDSISPAIQTFALGAFLIMPFNALSQGVFNETGLFINGVDVFVDGAISNGGEIQNDGLIVLSGDWKSEGKYGGAGILKVNGSAPQRISHYGQSVSSVVIAGWGTKYIKGELNISSSLTLENGIVEVSEADVLNVLEGATVIGGSPDSYVDGALTVEGTGYKFFPVGKNGNYAPVEFLDVQGESPQYSLEAFENAPVVSVEDAIVRNAIYWQRKDVRGKFGSSPVAVEYDRDHFEESEDIILVAGTTWDEQFLSIKDVEHSSETDKIATRIAVSSPIILLGEISERWTEADFYFSTALSPHASHSENHKVKIFGGRLSADGFHFQVFDRWGDQVYESISLDQMSTNGWDGRASNGRELATGAYPFRMTALDKTGRRFERKGVITIIR